MVTGAAGGIGRAVCQAFADSEARVAAVDLHQGKVEAVAAALRGHGHVGLGTDLTLVEGYRNLVARVIESLGSIDVLVHLAAVLVRRVDVGEVTEEDWDRQLDLNLKGSFFLAREVASTMLARGSGGRIILCSSQAAVTGGFGGAVAYAASKGGIVSLVRGLARTYGPAGITVNAVAPGLVETHMLNDGLDPDLKEQLRRDTPLGRIAEPSEIAAPILFLASRHASFVTGAILNLSGGLAPF